jgi:ComF family protein
VWLGLATPPLAERMAEAGWTPDEPRAFCSRCGQQVGPHEADDTGCSRCRARRLAWSRLVRLGSYTGMLREAVQEVKFTRWRRLGHDLGRMLGRSLAVALENAGVAPQDCALVPVPCSFRRRIVRGIDHTLVLARGVAAASGVPILRALARKHRPSQVTVPTSRRAANVSGSIRLRRGADLADRLVIVLDDVTTTGATLTAACRAAGECCKPRLDGGLRRPRGIWVAVAAVTPGGVTGSPSG